MALDLPSYLLGKSKGGSGGGLTVIVVEELPQTGDTTKLYLVPKQDTGDNNIFEEYIWVENEWELIGTTDIDLTDYVKNTDYMTTTNGGVAKINANQGITIFSTGQLATVKATDSEIDAKTNNYKPIVPANLNYALKDTAKQYSTMPTASADNVGKIYQYTGTTDSTYTNGYFYQCVSDGGDPATYSWENINVQESSGGDSIPVFTIPKTLTLNYLQDTSRYFLTEDEIAYWTPILSEAMKNGEPFSMIINCKYKMGQYGTLTYSSKIYSYRHFNQGSYFMLDPIFLGSYGRDASFQLVGIWDATTQTFTPERIEGLGYLMHQSNQQFGLSLGNTTAYTPTNNYDPATKKYVDDKLTTLTGYDATKTQTLKNVNGTLTWVDD